MTSVELCGSLWARGDRLGGMTVTSLSSLSVEPPALIVSINRASSSWPLVKRYGFFGVNILTSDQVEIAERFTGKGGLKGADRFAGAEWTTRASGVPLLTGALAAIDCEVEDIVERHSHAILIGRLDVRLCLRRGTIDLRFHEHEPRRLLFPLLRQFQRQRTLLRAARDVRQKQDGDEQQQVDDDRHQDAFSHRKRTLNPRSVRAIVLKVDVHQELTDYTAPASPFAATKRYTTPNVSGTTCTEEKPASRNSLLKSSGDGNASTD